MSEEQLRDSILRHALQLQRLSAGHEAEAVKILDQLERELKMLLASNALSQATKSEINDLVRQAQTAIDPAYGKLAEVVDTHALALVVADRTVQAMKDVFPANVATPERLDSLTTDVLIDGAPSSAWWSKQGEDTAFKFAAAVRQGIINGETNEQIVRRIAGSRTETGLLDIARNNARALVQSSVMSAANEARLATFRTNAGLLDGVRWLSTLDSHTCVRCAALDGQAWSLDGEPLKGTKLQFQSPPKHWSCRCVLSPIPKGIPGLNLPEGQRASAVGPVSAKTTFDDFLKRNRSFAEKVLGTKRAALFEAGKLTLTDFVTGGGQVLSLGDL